MQTSNNSSDPRRVDKIVRYKPSAQGTSGAPGEDPTTDYMNVLGMIFSMCGLMMRVVHFCSCDVLPSKPTANDTSMVQYINSSILSIVFG
ncbi:protein Asterix-like [Procambarus clarkii]|uniref:protein Asterix-like n=1 Tax=Procambarus clarkii TaxID=6728 RepID=UPI003742C92C